MAGLPFRRELEDLFVSDKSIVLKMLGGAFVSSLVAAREFFKEKENAPSPLPMTTRVFFVVGAGGIGAFVVLFLSLRDVVIRRVESGKRVHPILRAYMGKDRVWRTVALWFVTVIIVTFIVTLISTAL